MPALDTNVQVRYVVQDDTLQRAAAKRLVRQCLADGRSIFVPVTVALEQVALQLFRDGAADFADCLHIALATQAGEQPLRTFDKGAAKVIGAQLLRRR